MSVAVRGMLFSYFGDGVSCLPCVRRSLRKEKAHQKYAWKQHSINRHGNPWYRSLLLSLSLAFSFPFVLALSSHSPFPFPFPFFFPHFPFLLSPCPFSFSFLSPFFLSFSLLLLSFPLFFLFPLSLSPFPFPFCPLSFLLSLLLSPFSFPFLLSPFLLLLHSLSFSFPFSPLSSLSPSSLLLFFSSPLRLCPLLLSLSRMPQGPPARRRKAFEARLLPPECRKSLWQGRCGGLEGRLVPNVAFWTH